MYERYLNRLLLSRLDEPRRTIQALLGPRQSGKTTAVLQVLERTGLPSRYATADEATVREREWIRSEWATAREICERAQSPAILVLDEVQKIPGWSETVKALWDEDTRLDRDVRVVILGSSPWLIGRGMSESLAGRFEVIRATHWTWPECRDAFGWNVDDFVFHGGYPGAAGFVDDTERWRSYIKQTIIETTVSRDVLHMSRVDKPAVLRRALYLACEYSARELSLTKMMGMLEDAGNVTTLAHYLDLLEGAGLVSALQKHAAEPVRRRASVPKMVAHDTALVSALSGRSPDEARSDKEWWGRLVESAVGATLVAWAQRHDGELRYWRRRDLEVDYVIALGTRIRLIEVKTGTKAADPRGFAAFRAEFGSEAPSTVVGTGGVPLREFLESDPL